jgi:hypothetical protein
MQAPSVGFNYVRLPSFLRKSLSFLTHQGHRLLPAPGSRLLRRHHMHARNH